MSDNDYDYITIILQVRAKLRYPGNWPVNAANERNKQNRTTQTHTHNSRNKILHPQSFLYICSINWPIHTTSPSPHPSRSTFSVANFPAWHIFELQGHLRKTQDATCCGWNGLHRTDGCPAGCVTANITANFNELGEGKTWETYGKHRETMSN